MGALELIAGVLGGTTLAALGTVTYHAFLSAWQRLEAVRTEVARQRSERWQLKLAEQTSALTLARQQWNLERDKVDRARVLSDDATFVMLDSRTVLDLVRGILFDVSRGVLNISPAVCGPEQKRRLVEAMANLGAPAARAAVEAEPGQEADLPNRVPGDWALQELGRPSFSNLALGVAMRDGQPELVRGDMTRLVHVAVGGSSGTGKSVFARWLAYQLALAGDVDLTLVDLELATFAPFSQCDRLLWPVADTERDALAIFDALVGEMEQRKVLYSEYPGVDSLNAYNSASGDSLKPVVCLVDEATALLVSNAVNKALRTLALRSRKYGVWLILFGQDWRGASLDIAIRNQLSARLSFKTMSKSQSHVLLGCPDAYDLDASKPGRCIAVLPGLGKTTLQTPMLSRDNIMDALTGDGPRYPMPEPDPDPQVELIRELAEQGLSDSAIAEQVYGYKNGDVVDRVRRIRNNGMGDG